MSADLAVPLTGGRAELRLARQAALALAVLSVPVLALAGLANGAPGVAGAAAGLGLVALLFVAAGVAQGLAARRSRKAVFVVMAAGVVVRLVAYLLALWGLAQIPSLHRPSLAIATAVGFVVILNYELRVISRTPELYWLESASDNSAARAAGAARPLSTRRS